MNMSKKFFITIIASILLLSSCSTKSVKADTTPNDILELYSVTQYKTLIGDYSDSNSINYDYSVKVYDDENESRNYLFVYFFEDNTTANEFYKENNSKTGLIWIFGLIFGESLNVKYEKYNYMVLEYNNNTSEEMINMYKNFIYE